MTKLRKVWWFLVDYWWIPALVILTVAGWILFRWHKPDAPGSMLDVQNELDIIRVGAEAREMEIQLGTNQTIQHVKDKYAAKTATLDATQMLKVKELEDDPVELARYLERLTRG